ncbi:MAG: AmpG family muropeptide MFS transporter [Desulfobulbaceae bacterium]|jgi:PAT family beta-lactamase induction signal transducer AmpG|nr:AmpG family muropeptide MFS transporter [Desulfobulbaceae bacterium]HKJ13567.1 AmpG family muropeptide MFS transporter [Desulfobulbales bacterium]MDH3542476.1 AmpG family muropeptide MFS transporter [Desulfobulbaceae bacterium]MDH3775891.1 AmpG family muropeptide MFS transporter [Desulfobulbaceae bacterium]MDH3782448.1 AmpG family muropeptide MFS transporter [Desulfobulbaceae bacterium]
MSRSTIKIILSPKMLAMFTLGFASGFPFYIVRDVLKLWLTDANIDLGTIGLFSAVALPYTWKFVWSPVMDGVTPPFLGRRRAWMLMTQIGLLILIAAMGQLDPTKSLKMMAVVAFCIAIFSASQDIVLDAFRREYLTDEELGFGTGIWMNAWRFGMFASTGTAFLLSDSIGYPNVHLVLSLMMGIGIITTLIVSEPDTGVAAPQTLQEAVIEPFREFFSRGGAWWVLIFILLYKIGDNMAGAMNIPFILKMGFTKQEYFVIVKGIGMFALFGGAFLGGIVMIRLGIANSLWVFGILQAISTACFALLVVVGKNHVLLTGIVTFEFLATGLGQAAYASYMAVQTNKRFTATQYAMMTSLMAIPGTVAAAITGYMAEYLGWSGFYIVCALVALPGMLLLIRIAPWGSSNQEIDASLRQGE